MFRLLSYHRRILIFMMGVATAFSSPYTLAAEFRVFKTTSGYDHPDFQQYNIGQVTPTYRAALYGTYRSDDAIFGSVNEQAIRRAVAGVNASGLVFFDVEHLLHLGGGVKHGSFEENVQKLKQMADIAHDANPNVKMGFYSILPARNYWAPNKNDPQALAKWREYNVSMKPVADKVDVIFPSLYTFYDDPEGWVKYAKANIAEAKKYGKPVYALVWHQYHGSNDKLGGKLIPGDFWRLQLETIKEAGADGVILWGTRQNQEPSVKQDAPWWQETKKFIANLGASVPQTAPGVLNFSSEAYSANEGDGSARITVTRTGGSHGVVSVDYTTADGTANEGADYTFTNGGLTFADGDKAGKTFIVPIIDDADIEGNETVKLSLTNPNGEATLGNRNTAVLTIVDNDERTREEVVMCRGVKATIVGTKGDDIIRGTPGPDVIHGLGGNDIIFGLGGDDIICGGPGNDQLFGGPGNDSLNGGRGFDYCNGGLHTIRDRATACERVRNVP